MNGFCLPSSSDHCRIGSLEMVNEAENGYDTDHCRIGSLEITAEHPVKVAEDHCRIGSLEILKGWR